MRKLGRQMWRADLRPEEAAQLAGLDRDIATLDTLRRELARERRILVGRVANRIRGRLARGAPLGAPDARFRRPADG